MAIDRAKVDPRALQALTSSCAARMETMRGYRIPWWGHWAELAKVFLPRRYKWFITPNNYARGTPINSQIVDETGLLAARTLATGLLAGLTSPTRPWFKLGLQAIEDDDIPEGEVKQWLAECTRRILEVYAQSNFYQSHGQAYHDLGVFGSAAVIQYEDSDDVVRFYVPELGAYFFALSNRLEVDTLYREYTYTVSECIKEFGYENCSDSVRQMSKSASSLDTEIVIGHAIEPNLQVYVGGAPAPFVVPQSFPYRECYWERTGSAGTQQSMNCLRAAGFREKPFTGLRWDVTSNDPYGRSPGMDALPATRQLQVEQMRKAEAIDKMVRPPMVASVSMKNEPLDMLPGGVNYVADPAAAGFKPAFTVEPRIAELMEDLREVQSRVEDCFFTPLFRMFTPDQTVQTATWVDAAQAEKIILLGPMIERMENEGLDETIARTFNVMTRRGLLPPPPEVIANMPLKISYISFLAEAQRASATNAIERTLSLTGNLVGVKPDAMDNLNVDKMIVSYADLMNLPPDLLNDPKIIAAMRQQRAEAQQAEASLAVGQAAATGAKTLSETEVGGGQNALQALMGG